MTYIDAHCHLADPRVGNDVTRLIEEAGKKGIGIFIQGGVSPEDWNRQRELQKRFPGKIITSFGVHPGWVADHTREEVDRALDQLRERMNCAPGRSDGDGNDCSDALGELGLDRGKRVAQEAEGSFECQIAAFEFQMELNRSLQKPLVLHVVRAHEEALQRLQPSVGLVHSFSGSREIARRYLDLGLTLSISGVITRDGYETLKRAVSYIPMDRLVIETDAPDQPPSNWTSPLNEPVSLFRTAEVVGKIRGIESRTVLETSSENIRRMFSL